MILLWIQQENMIKRISERLFSVSDNLSEYKYGHEDELSVQTIFLRCASMKTYDLRFFFLTHFQYLS